MSPFDQFDAHVCIIQHGLNKVLFIYKMVFFPHNSFIGMVKLPDYISGYLPVTAQYGAAQSGQYQCSNS